VIEWGKVPWSLWLYVAISIGQIVVLVFTASIHIAPLVFSIVFIAAWDFFLLRAVRWLWIGTVALGALFLAIDLATSMGTWHGDLIGAIDLGLLLLPATRRFFAASETAPATA
jgi:Na+-translocating ferredoxin:NAD+ oxidoreductase RnfD subunit